MKSASEDSVKVWIMSAYQILWLHYQGLLHVIAQRANVPPGTIEREVEIWISAHRDEFLPIARQHLAEILVEPDLQAT